MVAWDNITKTCPVCLKRFAAQRRSAIYCSATCRQRAHRKPPPETRIKDAYAQAQDGLRLLMTIDGRGFESIRAQKMIQSLVVEAIQALPDSTRKLIYEQIRTDFYRLS